MPGDEEAALAADVHAREAGIPAGDHLVLALLQHEGSVVWVVVGGVELGAVDQIAGVVDGIPLLRSGERARAGLGVNVAKREGDGIDAEGLADAGSQLRRDIAEFDVGNGAECTAVSRTVRRQAVRGPSERAWAAWCRPGLPQRLALFGRQVGGGRRGWRSFRLRGEHRGGGDEQEHTG